MYNQPKKTNSRINQPKVRSCNMKFKNQVQKSRLFQNDVNFD